MLPRRFLALCAGTIAVLLAALSLCAPARAQDAQESSDHEDEGVELNLVVGSSGEIFNATELDPASAKGAKFAHAMNAAIGCANALSPSSCAQATVRSWPWTRSVDIDFAALRAAARDTGGGDVSLWVWLPPAAFAACEGCNEDQSQPSRGSIFGIHLTERESEPQRAHIVFGYRWKDLALPFFPLLAIPLLLIASTIRMRRYALRAAASGVEGAWFSYARFLKLGTQSAWLIWLAALSLPGVQRWIEFVVERDGNHVGEQLQAFAWSILAVLPVASAAVICWTLSHPVFAQVYGAQWTRRELFLQTFWSHAAIVVPIVFYITGFVAIVNGDARAVIIYYGLAFATLLVGRNIAAIAAGRTKEAVGSGELRDRVFELAKNAKVRLKNLYVMSTAKSRMANAFAMKGNHVMLTDYLLTHLTRREVDAVVAHELTHLKKNHIAIRAAAVLVVLLIGMESLADNFRVGQIPVAIAISILVYFVVARLNERAADAGSVELLNDPEATITALAKITRLNKFPLSWSKWNGWLMTHPSTMRRAQAIARKAGIPPDRLAEVLRVGAADGHLHAQRTGPLGSCRAGLHRRHPAPVVHHAQQPGHHGRRV